MSKVRVHCPHCKKAYMVPAEALGRKVPCKGCDARFILQAASAAKPAAKAKPKKDDSKCPVCGTPLAPEAVLCVECGFNRKTGEAHRTRTEDDDEAEGRTYWPAHTAIPEHPPDKFDIAAVFVGVPWKLIYWVALVGALLGLAALAVVWIVRLKEAGEIAAQRQVLADEQTELQRLEDQRIPEEPDSRLRQRILAQSRKVDREHTKLTSLERFHKPEPTRELVIVASVCAALGLLPLIIWLVKRLMPSQDEEPA